MNDEKPNVDNMQNLLNKVLVPMYQGDFTKYLNWEYAGILRNMERDLNCPLMFAGKNLRLGSKMCKVLLFQYCLTNQITKVSVIKNVIYF